MSNKAQQVKTSFQHSKQLIIRTFSKQSIDLLNNSMPHVRVVKRYARYFKEEGDKYAINDGEILSEVKCLKIPDCI